ncbi:MAG: Flp family type IVb pilin [Clostridia bacterium]|nr:Flp family type IVb pilin [Clostridia bacterium]
MLKKWLHDEEGQGMVEYGLIIGLIAIVVIGALALLGPKIEEIFNEVNEEIDNAGAAGA